MAEKYRNRRKRFGLRLNLITGILNYELWKRSIIKFYLIDYPHYRGMAEPMRSWQSILL